MNKGGNKLDQKRDFARTMRVPKIGVSRDRDKSKVVPAEADGSQKPEMIEQLSLLKQ